jgi:putative ABC transport system permease protein
MVTARVASYSPSRSARQTPTSFNKRRSTASCGLLRRRARRSGTGAIQRAVFQKFPTVTVINIADVLDIVQQVIDQIALVIRFLSAFAILAGAIILAASVAGTKFRRVREVVILKTLGATRRQIGRIFSIEFLTLGAVAGIMGALLAGGFTNLVLHAARHRVSRRLGRILHLYCANGIAGECGWLARELPHPRAEAARSVA